MRSRRFHVTVTPAQPLLLVSPTKPHTLARLTPRDLAGSRIVWLTWGSAVIVMGLGHSLNRLSDAASPWGAACSGLGAGMVFVIGLCSALFWIAHQHHTSTTADIAAKEQHAYQG